MKNSIKNAILTGQDLTDEQYSYLYLITDAGYYSWDMFDAFYNNTHDRYDKNRWGAIWTATKMLTPKILRSVQKLNAFSRYKTTPDELLNVVCVIIADNIGNYDPTKSKFPKFISYYIEHELYTWDRDASPYYVNKNNLKFYSKEQLEEQSEFAVELTDSDFSSFRSLDDTLVKKEADSRFQKICDVCGIELDHNFIVTNLKDDKKPICNFVIIQKFLGGLDDECKQVCLNNMFDNQIIKEDPNYGNEQNYEG